MTTQYPGALDDFTNPTPSTSQNASRTHSQQHGDLNDAVEAIEEALGTLPGSGPLALPANLASSEVGKGSDLVAFHDQTAPAYLKTVSDMLNGLPVSIVRFLDRTQHAAIRAGVNAYDCSPGFQDAATNMPAGGVIYIPRGFYTLNSAIAYGDKMLSWIGEDKQDAQLRFTNGTSGFFVTNTSAPGLDDQKTATFKNLWLLTNNASGVSTVKAISVVGPEPVGDGGQTQNSLVVDNVFMCGTQRFDFWWPYGVYTNHAPNVHIDRCAYQGKANDVKGHAFRFEGKTDSVDVRFSSILFADTGITQDSSLRENYGSEGLVVLRCGMDDVNIGIQKVHNNVSGEGEPQFQIYDTFITARQKGIYGVNAKEIVVANSLIYMQGTALVTIDADPTGIHLRDQSGDRRNKNFNIIGTQVRLLDNPSGTGRGLLADMSEGIVVASQFIGHDRAIDITSLAQNVYVARNNRFDSNGISILNGGTTATTDQPLMTLPGQDFGTDQVDVGNAYVFADTSGALKISTTRISDPNADGSHVAPFGPELAQNGFFDSGVGWTAGTGWSIASGKATHVTPTGGNLTSAIAVGTGRRYRIEVAVSRYVAGGVQVGFTGGTDIVVSVPSALGTHVLYVVANTGNTTLALIAGGAFDGDIDSVSVREVRG